MDGAVALGAVAVPIRAMSSELFSGILVHYCISFAVLKPIVFFIIFMQRHDLTVISYSMERSM